MTLPAADDYFKARLKEPFLEQMKRIDMKDIVKNHKCIGGETENSGIEGCDKSGWIGTETVIDSGVKA